MIYYQVLECYPDIDGGQEPRLIYTFENESHANEMLELILRYDPMNPNVWVEEYESTT